MLVSAGINLNYSYIVFLKSAHALQNYINLFTLEVSVRVGYVSTNSSTFSCDENTKVLCNGFLALLPDDFLRGSPKDASKDSIKTPSF